MLFKVYDRNTGKEADPYEIALHEDWAKGLVYCDMEGFAILDDGNLVLLDECGHIVYCPAERFKIKYDVGQVDTQCVWKRCKDENPKKDGEYIVASVNALGMIDHISDYSYTTEFGWNTMFNPSTRIKFEEEENRYWTKKFIIASEEPEEGEADGEHKS